MPAGVARWLSSSGHEAWTAHGAHLEAASDEEIIIYAEDRAATLVTTNRDCAVRARRMRSASVVWLQVVEVEAQQAMVRATEWLSASRLPNGRVLRVRKTGDPVVMAPLKPRKLPG